jgi:hypothetical protein
MRMKLGRYRNYCILLAAEVLILGVYLLVSQSTYRIGFPLDDAWIHQTYARNLAQLHQWAYLPGKISGGSTSPFWTVILAIGYVLKLHPLVWAFFIGGAVLYLLAVTSESVFRKLCKDYQPKFPLIGLLMLSEWHLCWSALSGMETLLISLFVVMELYLLLQERPGIFLCGLLAGAAVWIRPDGLSILIPAICLLIFKNDPLKIRARNILIILAGFAAAFIPYLAFNQMISGTIWPNTFYAKQAEYAELLQTSIFTRLFSETVLPLVGVGAVLLPGGIYSILRSIKDKNWILLGAFLWAGCYLFAYAWRLPVTYQHGRYVIPTIPVILLICAWGFRQLHTWLRGGRSKRILYRAWQMTIPIVAIVFLAQGAAAYASDVAIIESNMVDTAIWIQANTPVDSVIAVHDIGAVGYYSDRKLLDLAGLVNPEVIPFIRNEAGLKTYLNDQKVDYLVTLPDWYTDLQKEKEILFTASDRFVKAYKQQPMTVFKW